MILKIVPDVVPGTQPVLMEKSSTVSDAAQLMQSHDVGAVLVVENKKLVGIFTERDVSFRVVAAGYNPERITLDAVMTAQPQTVQADDTVLFALELMEEHHIRHLPIYNAGNLVGVVAFRDVLFSTARQIAKELASMSVKPPKGCRIATDIMRKNILITLRPDSPVQQASVLMREYDIGAVLVVQDKELVGIFTERDVSFRVVAQGLDPDLTLLSDVMSTDPVTVCPGESCDTVAEKMHAGHFRHLPIKDGNQPVGILSIRDLYTFIRQTLQTHFETAMINRTRDMISSE